MITKVAKLLLVGLVLSATCAYATELVLQKWVSVSRSLAGQVVVAGTSEPARDVTVELCSPGWKEVIASTKTDDKGRFSLEPVAKSKVFYLRVSAPGMNIYQLRVRIDKHVGQELKIHLSVAT
jgi:5-hydroxyisourate hydrolase-like protein (transthyretin family)